MVPAARGRNAEFLHLASLLATTVRKKLDIDVNLGPTIDVWMTRQSGIEVSFILNWAGGPADKTKGSPWTRGA